MTYHNELLWSGGHKLGWLKWAAGDIGLGSPNTSFGFVLCYMWIAIQFNWYIYIKILCQQTVLLRRPTLPKLKLIWNKAPVPQREEVRKYYVTRSLNGDYATQTMEYCLQSCCNFLICIFLSKTKHSVTWKPNIVACSLLTLLFVARVRHTVYKLFINDHLSNCYRLLMQIS